MRRMLPLIAASGLVLGAAVAHADEVTGIVKNVDPTRNTFEVKGTTFVADANNTVGTPLNQIEEGDKVTVFYQKSTEGPITNATSITKESD